MTGTEFASTDVERLTALVVFEPDAHSAKVLAEKFVRNDPFFDFCIACGSFTCLDVDVGTSAEAAACVQESVFKTFDKIFSETSFKKLRPQPEIRLIIL